MNNVTRGKGTRHIGMATNATIAASAGTKTNRPCKAAANPAARGTTRLPTVEPVAILAPRAGTKMPWHRCPLEVVNTVAQVSIKIKMLNQVVKRIAMLGHT